MDVRGSGGYQRVEQARKHDVPPANRDHDGVNLQEQGQENVGDVDRHLKSADEAGETALNGDTDAGTGRETRRPRKGGLNQELRGRVKAKYQPKTVNLMVRYNKLGSQLADFSNNVAFLSRCANMSMIPKSHRVYNTHVRNTRAVVRLLDQCSYRVMIADLEHNRRRKYQVMKNRERIEGRLKDIMSPEDFDEVRKICDENREGHFADVKERQRKEYQDLADEYKNNETRRPRRRQYSQRTDADSVSSVGGSAEPRGDHEGNEASGQTQGKPPARSAKANDKSQAKDGGPAQGAEGGGGGSAGPKGAKPSGKGDNKSKNDEAAGSAKDTEASAVGPANASGKDQPTNAAAGSQKKQFAQQSKASPQAKDAPKDNSNKDTTAPAAVKPKSSGGAEQASTKANAAGGSK